MAVSPYFQPDLEPRRPMPPRRRKRRRAGIRPLLLALIVAALAPALVRQSPPARAGQASAPSRPAGEMTAGWRGELRPAARQAAPVRKPAAKKLRQAATRKPRRRRILVWATAYCPTCRVCDTGKVTATGRRAFSRGVAVAERGRRAVPLGSRIHVPGFGWLRVDDTGGGVHSDQIDIRFRSHRRAVQWGRRLVWVACEP